MNEDRCILCGRSFPTGLNILGCLICFPCERQLLGRAVPGGKRRRLLRIYRHLEA